MFVLVCIVSCLNDNKQTCDESVYKQYKRLNSQVLLDTFSQCHYDGCQ